MMPLTILQLVYFAFAAALAFLITDWMPRELMGSHYRGAGGYAANVVLALVCFVLFNGYGDINYALVGLGGSAAATFGRAVQQIRERYQDRKAARRALAGAIAARRVSVTVAQQRVYQFIPRYPFDRISGN